MLAWLAHNDPVICAIISKQKPFKENGSLWEVVDARVAGEDDGGFSAIEALVQLDYT